MGTDLGCQALFKETALNAHFSLLYLKLSGTNSLWFPPLCRNGVVIPWAMRRGDDMAPDADELPWPIARMQDSRHERKVHGLIWMCSR